MKRLEPRTFHSKSKSKTKLLIPDDNSAHSYTHTLLSDIKKEDLWEKKYVAGKQEVIDLDSGNISDSVFDYLDKFGAVLYAVNSLGEIQRYYNDEQDYLASIKHLVRRSKND